MKSKDILKIFLVITALLVICPLIAIGLDMNTLATWEYVILFLAFTACSIWYADAANEETMTKYQKKQEEQKHQIELDADEYADSAVECMVSNTSVMTKEQIHRMFREVYLQVSDYSINNYKKY